MTDWIRRTFQHHPIAGLVATSSAAASLAQAIADILRDTKGLRVALTPYSCETGRIGTDINVGRAVHRLAKRQSNLQVAFLGLVTLAIVVWRLT